MLSRILLRVKRQGRSVDCLTGPPKWCSGTGGLVRVVPAEFGDEVQVKDMVSSIPGPLLWTIVLPVNQVLKSHPTAAGPNQASNREGWTPPSIRRGGGTTRDCGLSWIGFSLDTWKVG